MQKLPVALLAVFALALPLPVSAADGGLPQRQPGKWKLSTEMDEGRGPIKQSLTMCITAEMEKATADIVDAECAYAVDRVTSRTEMSGDFKKAFSVKIVSTTVTQPPAGKPVTRERKITQSGEHLGDDCGDIKPGEAVTEDGSRVMVQ
jgi:hypothetical protein